MKCFRTCRKKYELEYVEMWKPVETPKALELGTLYHLGLETLLKTENLASALAVMRSKIKYDVDPVADEFTYVVVKQMITAFDKESGWRDWQIISIERPFEVSTGYAKRLLGKLDGLVKIDGNTYLLEHKTTSQWGTDGSTYLHNLLWDDQATNYLYAHAKMLEDGSIIGDEVKGVFYCIVEKPTIRPYKATPLEQRKYKKDGSLYANQHEADETPAEFEARLNEWYWNETRVHTHLVYRTPEEIRERINDFNLTLKDIAVAERDGTFYRNPEACKILPCAYRPKCLENNPESDCLFVRKAARNEELIENNTNITPNTEETNETF